LAADGAPSFVCVPDLATRSGEFVLEGDEAHYLARVVRVRPGERFTATDGAGLSATMEVLATAFHANGFELSMAVAPISSFKKRVKISGMGSSLQVGPPHKHLHLSPLIFC